MRSSAVISIIIPFRNAGPHFAGLLATVVNQEATDALEILLVDNGSTDGSRACAEAVRGRHPVTIVDATGRANAAYARNVGAGVARGEMLMFVDADDEIADGYVEAMARALAEHPLVTSRVDSVTLNPEWVREAHGPPWQADGVAVFFGFMPGTGVNIGVRRALFERVGGFPEAFSGSQDIVFAWRAQLAGAALHFVPDAVYRYRYRDSLAALFRQTRNWGTSNVLLYRHFRGSGMRRRPVVEALRDWRAAAGVIVGTRDRAKLASAMVTLGYCVGRIMGSVRYRCFYP